MNDQQGHGDETRIRIRTVARKLMSEKGIEITTVRDIAAAAGVNLSAVNYHFRSKAQLASEVLSDVARRSALHRLELLDRVEAEAEAAGRPVTTAEVVSCFVAGYIRDDAREEGDLLAKLLLKNRLAPTEWTTEIIRAELDHMARRFIEALGRSAPYLSAADIGWRYHFMVATVVIALNDNSNPGRIRELTNGACDTQDPAELRRQLERQLTRTFAADTPPVPGV